MAIALHDQGIRAGLKKPHGEGGETDENTQGVLWVHDFEKQECEVLAQEVDQVEVNPSGKTMLYFCGNQIRILEAGVTVPDESENDGVSAGCCCADKGPT